MKDTFDVYEWNKNRYLNENKGQEEANKIIQHFNSSTITKLNDEELKEFYKTLSEAFDMSLNFNQD
jgi:succinate dehydrogenase flavin-adding protein (antitoxin of CptAB toxin-antitoxin module)